MATSEDTSRNTPSPLLSSCRLAFYRFPDIHHSLEGPYFFLYLFAVPPPGMQTCEGRDLSHFIHHHISELENTGALTEPNRSLLTAFVHPWLLCTSTANTLGKLALGCKSPLCPPGTSLGLGHPFVSASPTEGPNQRQLPVYT